MLQVDLLEMYFHLLMLVLFVGPLLVVVVANDWHQLMLFGHDVVDQLFDFGVIIKVHIVSV